MRKPITSLRAECVEGRVVLGWYKSTPFTGEAHEAEFSSFRVFRREEPGFVFGSDYAEYFLGLSAQGAEKVYDGALPASNGRKYLWVDDAVQPARTYCYFVATATNPATGPAPVRVRRPDVCWSYAATQERLRRLADRHAGLVKLGVCGQSAAGRDIPLLTVGARGPALGLAGLIHPGESGPELIAPALEELLDRAPEVFERARVVAVPAINVDGREAMARGTPWYLRTTAQGVDLNRNFPVDWDQADLGYGLDSSDPNSMTWRGPAPASSAEMRAVMEAFGRHAPALVFSFHCLASICGLPALCARRAEGDARYMAACRQAVDTYGRGLFPNLAPAETWMRAGTKAGSLPAWIHQQFGAPAFDLEGGIGDDERPWATDRTDDACLELWRRRHARAIEAVLRLLSG